MFFFIGFVLIGFAAGFIAEIFVSNNRVPHNRLTLVLLGLAGALIGGSLALALFRYGRGQVSQSGYAGTREIGIATVPADWLSLFAAITVAVLVIACYELIKTVRSGH
ncbi:MAG: hypothetical protein ND866_20380 [Pyrinomonadaceae bacterium]|nr:hypothetical protein [Pyrinomonadaceae bacterium]